MTDPADTVIATKSRAGGVFARDERVEARNSGSPSRREASPNARHLWRPSAEMQLGIAEKIAFRT